MDPTALLLVLAVAAHLASATADAPSQEPPATPCAAAIVSFSPCLAHVAVVAPPALPTAAPTGSCCAAFLRAVSTGDGDGGGGVGCFCHLLRDPLFLGFPVDAARLGALLPTCASANASAATIVQAEALFADKCRDLKSLPEMHLVPASPPPSPTTPKISPAATLDGHAAWSVWIGYLLCLPGFPCGGSLHNSSLDHAAVMLDACPQSILVTAA